MKGSLLIVGCFAAGCLVGWQEWLPHTLLAEVDTYSKYALYALMLLVGLSIGSDPKIREIVFSLRLKMFVVPLATIVGTFAGTALVALFLSPWTLPQVLAAGSGFGYYSLSSILITELMAPTLGNQEAAALGTLALMANIVRELMVLLGAPLLVRCFGPLAPICAGGATTMDTTLPIIARYSGQAYVFIAIFHAILIDLSVPFFVSFFCSFG